MKKNLLLKLAAAVVVLFVLLQLVPYGRSHANPPVTQEVKWDSPQTRDLAVRACYDCHSNETVWPWYSNIAPVSWLLQHDVEEGRQNLNFSEMDKNQRKADEAARELQRGKMPMPIYLPMHPEANLSQAEKDQLVQGLKASLGGR
jgi:hypothetical protein